MKRLAFLLLTLPVAAAAESYADMVTAELRPGWRLPDGSHMAALHLHLAPGWKTYWRTPGDAGIPPEFRWRGARNTRGVTVEWPAPMVFWQSGMRSVGYAGEVVLPLRVALRNGTRDARLGGTVEIGICKDVCIPRRLRLSADLPADVTRVDPVIAAALADLPFGPEDAGVRDVRCSLSAQSGSVGLRVEIDMPPGTGKEETVIELPDPNLWVADPETGWQGGKLVAQTQVSHMTGAAFALDRSDMTITVLGGAMPVEIEGCGR